MTRWDLFFSDAGHLSQFTPCSTHRAAAVDS
jgi:hypothetical protein